jgi:hypothetical protein
VQLHDLRAAVEVWGGRYGQRAWLRQLEPEVTREAEDAALRTVARLDGIPFPSTAQLAGRWLRGRVPSPGRFASSSADVARTARTVSADPAGDQRRQTRAVTEAVSETWLVGFPWRTEAADPAQLAARATEESPGEVGEPARLPGRLRDLARRAGARLPRRPDRHAAEEPAQADDELADDEGRATLETAYCAEVVAITYQEMGLLPAGRRPNWYDPGRFWSGDDLPLALGYLLGAEIAVEVPAAG